MENKTDKAIDTINKRSLPQDFYSPSNIKEESPKRKYGKADWSKYPEERTPV